MNKKNFATIVVLVLPILICFVIFCQNSRISPDKAEKLCYEVMGEKDEITGFAFSFVYDKTIEKEGKEYHVIRAEWFVNNNHLSYIGNFFVSVDGKEIYDGYEDSDTLKIENLVWNK